MSRRHGIFWSRVFRPLRSANNLISLSVEAEASTPASGEFGFSESISKQEEATGFDPDSLSAVYQPRPNWTRKR